MSATLKPLALKRKNKSEREKKVLLGLVDLFIPTNKPVGSNTLRENGFADLSSATIRNYFVTLEEEGYLTQQHSSGGRIPTSKAFTYYAEHYLASNKVNKDTEKTLNSFLKKETKQIKQYIQKAAENLSDLIKAPVFLTEPSLEMDFIQQVKFFPVDAERLIAVLYTDYGVVHTETIYSSRPVKENELLFLEDYFYWRIGKKEKPFSEEISLKWAQRIYNELIFRHLMNRSSASFYTSGISKLLHYPECTETTSLANGLSLFENHQYMEALLQNCFEKKDLVCLIGKDLGYYLPSCTDFCVLAVPYKVGQTVVGSIALFAPMRVPYKTLIPLLKKFTELLSENLTKNIYKYQIPFDSKKASSKKISSSKILLEDKGIQCEVKEH